MMAQADYPPRRLLLGLAEEVFLTIEFVVAEFLQLDAHRHQRVGKERSVAGRSSAAATAAASRMIVTRTNDGITSFPA